MSSVLNVARSVHPSECKRLSSSSTYIFQKCDRQSPCGLCVSRGVSHLCRWESAPVARPLPVRPPRLDKPSPDHSESTPSSSTSTIDDLKARIDLLERTVMAQHSLLVRNDPSVADTNISSDTPHESQNTEPDVEGYSIDTASKNPLGRDVQEAAMALASLSLGTHHGEYVGRGTVVCALNDVRMLTRRGCIGILILSL